MALAVSPHYAGERFHWKRRSPKLANIGTNREEPQPVIVNVHQLNAHLNASFSTIGELNALSAAVMYRQFASAAGYDENWIIERLAELANTLEREAPALSRPEFGSACAAMLRRIAADLRDGDHTLILNEDTAGAGA